MPEASATTVEAPKPRALGDRGLGVPGGLARRGDRGAASDLEGTIRLDPDGPSPPIPAETFRREPEVDLFPGFAIPDVNPDAGADFPERQVAEEEGHRIERRLDELFAEDRAIETAKHRADSYWHDLRRRLERGFEAPLDLVEAGPGSGTLSLGGSLSTYREQARAYALTGNPYGDGPRVPGSRRSMGSELVDSIADQTLKRPLQEPIGDRGVFSRKLVTVVDFEQAPDGSLVGVHLVTSSGSPGHDRLALAQTREEGGNAMGELGPPPAQGRRTRWAFTSSLTIIPPLPMAGCALDAYFIPQECVYPMKKILRHRVRLLAIYDDLDVRRSR